ncbi:MAG: DUF6754 domain-containing protein [Candidatus Zixiibacteriota bacterium]
MKDRFVFRNKISLIFLLLFSFFLIGLQISSAQELGHAIAIPDSFAQAPAPAMDVVAKDAPNDNGHAIMVRWKLSADDGAGKNNVLSYEILRSDNPDTGFVSRGVVAAGTNQYLDRGAREKEDKNYFPSHKNFYYKIKAKSAISLSESNVSAPAYAFGQWFHTGKTSIFISTFLFTLFVLVFIRHAKKGKELYVRPIAGIDAIDDAIGRATEMGRPILYILGMGSAGDLGTIASLTILSRVAKKTAEYQTPLLVPVSDPVVLTVAQEAVRTGYFEAGRPDAYKEDSVFYLTSMQFAYVSAVNGLMLRQKTATNIYMGVFYAESLLLAETGNVAGSIQISGTDQVAQIPFFVAATDYTLIGEELYAASAYLGKEPLLLGAIKAQDWGKILIMISLILGTLAASFHLDFIVNLFRIKL